MLNTRSILDIKTVKQPVETTFRLPGLGSYTMKAIASYSYEGLVASASDISL